MPDDKKATHYLEYIGYYRLGAYLKFLLQENDDPGVHKFREGTCFDDALALYIFDRELRLLVMDALERIEVAVRSVISNVMCLKHGSHWYMDPKHLNNRERYEQLIARIKEETGFQDGGSSRRTDFLSHYYAKYNDPELPPSWMIAEAASLGVWSMVFSSLANGDDQKLIAQKLGVNAIYLESWLHSLTYLRNICAHHQLLWNRRLIIRPYEIQVDGITVKETDTFYAQAIIIQWLMRRISPQNEWSLRLHRLFQANPQAPLSAMGFPKDWERRPHWGLASKLETPKDGAGI